MAIITVELDPNEPLTEEQMKELSRGTYPSKRIPRVQRDGGI